MASSEETSVGLALPRRLFEDFFGFSPSSDATDSGAIKTGATKAAAIGARPPLGAFAGASCATCSTATSAACALVLRGARAAFFAGALAGACSAAWSTAPSTSTGGPAGRLAARRRVRGAGVSDSVEMGFSLSTIGSSLLRWQMKFANQVCPPEGATQSHGALVSR